MQAGLGRKSPNTANLSIPRPSHRNLSTSAVHQPYLRLPPSALAFFQKLCVSPGKFEVISKDWNHPIKPADEYRLYRLVCARICKFLCLKPGTFQLPVPASLEVLMGRTASISPGSLPEKTRKIHWRPVGMFQENSDLCKTIATHCNTSCGMLSLWLYAFHLPSSSVMYKIYVYYNYKLNYDIFTEESTTSMQPLQPYSKQKPLS